MQVNAVDNTSFGHIVNKKLPYYGPVKNTFKRQATIAEADHLEAIARAHYMKFQKAEDALDEIGEIDSPKKVWQLIKTFAKMGYHKLQSADYIAHSHQVRHSLDKKLSTSLNKAKN